MPHLTFTYVAGTWRVGEIQATITLSRISVHLTMLRESLEITRSLDLIIDRRGHAPLTIATLPGQKSFTSKNFNYTKLYIIITFLILTDNTLTNEVNI